MANTEHPNPEPSDSDADSELSEHLRDLDVLNLDWNMIGEELAKRRDRLNKTHTP